MLVWKTIYCLVSPIQWGLPVGHLWKCCAYKWWKKTALCVCSNAIYWRIYILNCVVYAWWIECKTILRSSEWLIMINYDNMTLSTHHTSKDRLPLWFTYDWYNTWYLLFFLWSRLNISGFLNLLVFRWLHLVLRVCEFRRLRLRLRFFVASTTAVASSPPTLLLKYIWYWTFLQDIHH